MLVALIIIGLLLCGLLAYAIAFAYWQRRFLISAKEDYRIDMFFSAWPIVFGPTYLIVIYLFSENAKYGLKWR